MSARDAAGTGASPLPRYIAGHANLLLVMLGGAVGAGLAL